MSTTDETVNETEREIETDTKAAGRGRRWLRRGLWGLGLLLTVYLLLVQVANWRGARAWERAEARLKDSGEKRSLPDLVPAPVADADNFYGTEVLLGFNRVVDGETSAGEPAAQREALEAMDVVRKVDGHTRPKGKGLGRRTGAVRDMAAELAYVGAAGTLAVDGFEGNEAEMLAAALEAAYGEIFAELESAAERPHSQVESNLLAGYKRGDLLFNVQVPHLQAVQALAKVMKLRAQLAAATGNRARARSSLAVMFRLADGIGAEPTLITHLVAQLVRVLAADAVWAGLEQRCFSTDDLVWLQEVLADSPAEAEYLGAMRAELLGGLDAIDYLDRGGRESAQMVQMISGVGDGASEPSPMVAGVVMGVSPGGWIDQNRATLVNWTLDYQILPFKTGGPVAVMATADEFEDMIIDAKTDWIKLTHSLIPCLVMPVTQTVTRRMMEGEFERQLAVVACALERYRTGKGGYPEGLGELVDGGLLAALPTDPYGGEGATVQYRQEGEGFVLWGLGRDGEDDGGVAGETRERDRKFEGDIVWRQRLGAVEEEVEGGDAE